MTTAIEVFMPALTLDQAKERWNILVHLREQVLQENTDYGVVPGTTKPTLLKPGAEKLCAQFGLTPRFELVDCIKDWNGTEHGEPLFYFEYKCRLYRGDLQVGEGDGSCNSWEKKYRYRKANIVCPTCGQETIIKSKYPPKNNPRAVPGWYCNTKSGGCGASFDADEPAIVQQPRGNVPNPDVFDQINTIKKMSQKRALIAAVLVATGASEFFTQDVEDLHISNPSQVVEGEVVETATASYSEPREQPKQRSRKGKKASPAEQPESEQQQTMTISGKPVGELRYRKDGVPFYKGTMNGQQILATHDLAVTIDEVSDDKLISLTLEGSKQNHDKIGLCFFVTHIVNINQARDDDDIAHIAAEIEKEEAAAAKN